jgi:hypothetical protein
MQSLTNARSEVADASDSGIIRHRPKPLGSITSIATPVSAFLPLARPPANPGSLPPM